MIWGNEYQLHSLCTHWARRDLLARVRPIYSGRSLASGELSASRDTGRQSPCEHVEVRTLLSSESRVLRYLFRADRIGAIPDHGWQKD